MAEIKFYGNILGSQGTTVEINHTQGSGLGFFGAGFGVSVPVNSQQSTTWITNASGTVNGPALNNTAMISSGLSTTAGIVNNPSVGNITLNNLPNYLCPLNIRFNHTQPVSVKNCKLRIFDRNDITRHASGVTTWVYEARHPSEITSVTSLAHRGNTEYTWFKFEAGNPMSDFTLTPSPGASGKNTTPGDGQQAILKWATNEGDTHTSSRHDWYLAISSEPDTPGAKQNYGLYFTLEYL